MENFYTCGKLWLFILLTILTWCAIIEVERKDMKESERLRKENDKLQAKVEKQLGDINKEMEDILKRMRGE